MLKKFSDFAQDEKRLDGQKVKIEDILDKEVEFTAFRISKSKIKDCDKYLTIQFKKEDEFRVIFTSSIVLAEQFKKYEKELPFEAKIKRENKYYTLA